MFQCEAGILTGAAELLLCFETKKMEIIGGVTMLESRSNPFSKIDSDWFCPSTNLIKIWQINNLFYSIVLLVNLKLELF